MTTRTTPILAVGAVVLWASAAAQSPSGAKKLSIPAEPLVNALNDLAQQLGLQVMFPIRPRRPAGAKSLGRPGP